MVAVATYFELKLLLRQSLLTNALGSFLNNRSNCYLELEIYQETTTNHFISYQNLSEQTNVSHCQNWHNVK